MKVLLLDPDGLGWKVESVGTLQCIMYGENMRASLIVRKFCY